MTASDAPQQSPASGDDKGGFELEMTDELLRRFQQELIALAAAVRAARADQRREKWRRPWSAASNPSLRRGLVVICIIGAAGSALGALLFFSKADWGGMAVWIGIGLLYVVFSFSFALLPRITGKLTALAGRWTDALQAARIRRSLEPAFHAAPYKVRQEFDRAHGTWTVRSQRSGEQTYCVSSEMVAYHGDVAWLLVKPGLIARPGFSAVVETADQQKLLHQFLKSCAVRVVDVRELGDRHQAQPT
jgi:hypothetical protein